MKTAMSIALALLSSVLVVPGAHAVDEGQSVPKLNSAALSITTLATSLVPLTNGAGKVTGIGCRSASSNVLKAAEVHFTVDGGSVRTITFITYPAFLDSDSKYNTGVIPMNIRFDSSIAIDIERSSTSSEVVCMASWGLD